MQNYRIEFRTSLSFEFVSFSLSIASIHRCCHMWVWICVCVGMDGDDEDEERRFLCPAALVTRQSGARVRHRLIRSHSLIQPANINEATEWTDGSWGRNNRLKRAVCVVPKRRLFCFWCISFHPPWYRIYDGWSSSRAQKKAKDSDIHFTSLGMTIWKKSNSHLHIYNSWRKTTLKSNFKCP